MDPEQLEYANLRKRLQPYIDDGLAESAAFMAWFFENYYRMEGVAGKFIFTTDHGFLDYTAGTSAKMYMMLAKASELVKLNGL